MTRTLRVRLGAGLLIGAAALSLAACGGKSIDPDGAAKSVVEVVSKQSKSKFKPTDVKCPGGVEAEVGVTFDCTFTGPEGPYVAHVKILSVDGDAVRFDINSDPVK